MEVIATRTKKIMTMTTLKMMPSMLWQAIPDMVEDFTDVVIANGGQPGVGVVGNGGEYCPFLARTSNEPG